MNSSKYDGFVNQEVSLTQNPPQQYNDLIKSTLLPFAPEGLNKVHLVDDITGTVANEYALRAAFMSHHEKVTGQTGYSPEEMEASQSNTGSSYTAVAFAGANHGNSLATLSLSSHPQKFNLPSLPFEILDFPSTQSEEGQVLEQFSSFLRENQETVASTIIQPMQAVTYETASPTFYRQLVEIAKENGVKVIVDEVHSAGGNSGHLFAHEAWNMNGSSRPDFVTFGRKM